jgi:hypothetical protein
LVVNEVSEVEKSLKPYPIGVASHKVNNLPRISARLGVVGFRLVILLLRFTPT